MQTFYCITETCMACSASFAGPVMFILTHRLYSLLIKSKACSYSTAIAIPMDKNPTFVQKLIIKSKTWVRDAYFMVVFQDLLHQSSCTHSSSHDTRRVECNQHKTRPLSQLLVSLVPVNNISQANYWVRYMNGVFTLILKFIPATTWVWYSVALYSMNNSCLSFFSAASFTYKKRAHNALETSISYFVVAAMHKCV